MSDVLFYHLTEQTLDQALPGLLERCLERQWRVVVQTSDMKRVGYLDDFLWAYRDDSFLPHGRQEDGEVQAANEETTSPIWITYLGNNPNKAQVRFLVDNAVPDDADASDYERLIYMFDGRDEFAVAEARQRWKVEKDRGHALTYWQQDEEGRWSKKA